jgi:hypothetical protein
MEENEEYKALKASYEAKKLTEEDIKLLLDTKFSKEITAYKDKLKGTDGKPNSQNLSLDELVTLRDEYKNEKYKSYMQDRGARTQISEDNQRQKAIDEYKKNNPDWNKSVFDAEEKARILEEENALLRENANKTNTTPVPEVPLPEISKVTTTTPETEDTTTKKERIIRAAYIAGAVIGGSTGILGGIQAVGIGALVCIAGGLLNTGVKKASERSIERWSRRLQTITDPAERIKLEKRIATWSKVNNFCKTSVSDFLRGARHGLLASSIFSGVFLGGHGLAWNTPEAISPISNPAGGNQGNPVGTGGTETGAGSNPETYQGNDFIDQNGQIHANGSPWDSKYVTGPEGNLPGGAENANNYVEGPWGRTPSVVNNFLKQNNVTDNSFLSDYDRDRILDETWLAIRNGDTNPDMESILRHINTDGTNRLLDTISQK